ncbi:MAG TPA: TonB-dependent receptor [Flavobacterium lutivivi]|nr:TonB-dependent receptor [Flavobacterium lutivivi]
MKKTFFIAFLLNFFVVSYSQNSGNDKQVLESKNDSLKVYQMQEVIVIKKKATISEQQSKPLTSIDDYLQKSVKVDMIKRGAYAWEPIINSMSTERTLVTIDGMRIFGACTDKMDPITSYVEVSNLSEVSICSGQEGSCFGSTIGGSIDLKRSKNAFSNQKWNFNLNSGFETNNQQKIIGAAINYADSLLYVDADFMHRNAENYNAGNDKEVLFSQFKKINFSTTSGFKLDKNKLIEGSIIYDKATDVGYPALPMDVSIAEAIITSIKFEYLPLNKKIYDWETKVYFNTITHKMDDTKRPFVPIHMDMPGWSNTFGYYSKIKANYEKHHLLFNLNSFYNKSKAEMTMYPENPNENPMYMLTWPDVRTLYNGLFLEDNFILNCHSSLKFSASIGLHSNMVQSEFGLNSLQIFYPEMKSQRNRFLKSISLNFNQNHNGLEFGIGTAYGERAPFVTEGYGFYLFNSFENYDNIGNPNLRNEKSLEANAYIGLQKEKYYVKLSSSYFHISDYIVAKPDMSLVPMTIGANGVKIYTAINYATIFNINLTSEFKLSKTIKWNSQLGYCRGKDFENNNLPFISPFSYYTTLAYLKNKFSAEIMLQGNAKHINFGNLYGEDKTPDYAVINANFGYKFSINKIKIIAKTGVENMLDTYYSTYTDWNNIPRQGRNFFVNLGFSL